jgi:hypothetical protein
VTFDPQRTLDAVALARFRKRLRDDQSAEDGLREHLTHAFKVPADETAFETAIDRLVAAVKAAGWVPARIEGDS